MTAYRLVKAFPILKSRLHLGRLGELLHHSTRAISFFALKLLSQAFGLSEAAEDELFSRCVAKEEQVWASYEGFMSNVYFFDIFEQMRYNKARERIKTYDYYASTLARQRILTSADLCSASCSVFGIILPRTPRGHNFTSLVPTPTTIRNLRRIATALLEDRSLLLQGEPGCGKMFLLTETIRYIGRFEDIVHIHLGNQTDGKLLLGAYVSGAQPGEFKWQPGVLTKAIQQGLIVVIEDIQNAQNEILSVLLPILERRQIYVSDQNQTIDAHTGFRIIATATLTNTPRHSSHIGSKRWWKIELESMDDGELITMINHKFPQLLHLSRLCLKIFRFLQTKLTDSEHSRLTGKRHLTIRDLIKFAKRLTSAIELYKLETNDSSVPEVIYEAIFREATEVYLGFLANKDEYRSLAFELGVLLQFASQKVQDLLERNNGIINENDSTVQIGRAIIQRGLRPAQRKLFAYTKHSFEIIERAAIAVSQSESLLLVGETGVGKTAAIQELARIAGRKLVSINMSQQTEGGDLLGGFKPVEPISLALQLEDDFDALFEQSFSLKRNEAFLKTVRRARRGEKWAALTKYYKDAIQMANTKFSQLTSGTQDIGARKRLKRDVDGPGLKAKWNQFAGKVELFAQHTGRKKRAFTFTFVEGILIRAIKRGEWVLLDEVNLAPPDTLDILNSLLKDDATITISERGDVRPIKAHKDFRLFANMNPSTDIGKRDLPHGIRSRFTEYFVRSLDEDILDLTRMVEYYLKPVAVNDIHVSHDVATLYIDIKHLNDGYHLTDSQGSKPEYSVRNLSRAMTFAINILPTFQLRQALFEGFSMCFATTLNAEGQTMLKTLFVHKLLSSYNIPTNTPSTHTHSSNAEYAHFPPFSIKLGSLLLETVEGYVLTPSINQNLLNLVRCVMDGRFPILLQGPTSSGKTSLISYLARTTGHRFVRINNHEQTDLQEYMGSYVSDETGLLTFRDGLLVQALRHGYWIILDELNLAPSDVLEALNRLLDDNRELLVPETQEYITPHPDFMLFATQNPHGTYAGRKPLSRAFRNRFLELHFDDIPESELEIILHQRCEIPKSYAAKIVETFKVRKPSSRALYLLLATFQFTSKQQTL